MALMERSFPFLARAQSGPQPQHVAIIMDGNGRWAKRRGLPRSAGHKRGGEALRAIVTAAGELGVRCLTVYAFSSENWKRPTEEVAELMQLLVIYLRREMRTLHENGVQFRAIGNRTRLSPDIRRLIEEAETLTRGNSKLVFAVALSYGGREECLRACRTLAAQAVSGDMAADAITEAQFEQALDTHGMPPLDLLIRTGGEQRLSNFLLWQAAYAELYFTETLWPEFTPEQFRQALQDFARRERRYGA